MVIRRLSAMLAIVTMLAFSGWGRISQGQTHPVNAPLESSATAPIGAMMANPYMNPYLNPYLNPVATQQPMTGRDAALYMYMANSARGGVGSGFLSGTRPIPGNALGLNQPREPLKANGRPALRKRQAQNHRREVAEMPDSVATPGASAARFFSPGPVNANGAGRYFDRPNSFFNTNGH